jgi:hypothetical protein
MALMPAPGTWSYVPPGTMTGGDPAYGDVDVVRFYLQDTDPDLRLMSDIELQYLVDVWYPKYDSLVYVAAVAADRVSAKFAGVVSVSADGVSVGVADLSERYAALAARLRQTHKDAQVGGEVDITNLLWDSMPDWSIDPLSFGVGMHDNMEAGRQNFGSGRYGAGYGYGQYEDTVRPGG